MYKMSRFINIETEIDLEDYKDEIFIYFKNKGIEGNLCDKLKAYLKEMKNNVYYGNVSEEYKKIYEDLDKIFFYYEGN